MGESITKIKLLQRVSELYDEFGIDIHSIPNNLQSKVNSLVKEIISLRSNKIK